MTAAIPSRGTARLIALERANDVKYAKTYWRHRVKSLDRADGLRLVADLIAEPPDLLGSTMAWEVVSWIKRLGKTRPSEDVAERVFALAEVSQFRSLGELTSRERAALSWELRLLVGARR